MRNNIITILKKELKRVFLDRKLAFAVFIMPGLTIAIIYSLMGGMIDKLGEDTKEHVPIVHVINMPAEFNTANKTVYGEGIIIVENVESEFEMVRRMVVDGDADVLLVFEKDFIKKALTELPSVERYINSIKDFSVNSGYMVGNILETMRISILTEQLGSKEAASVFYINYQDVAKEEEKAGKAISMLVPMLLTVFLFAGAMQVGMDIIAGEKERGTIA